MNDNMLSRLVHFYRLYKYDNSYIPDYPISFLDARLLYSFMKEFYTPFSLKSHEHHTATGSRVSDHSALHDYTLYY
jgi:hypothetical protein